jgi:molybdopterin adenylyltransferase
MSEFDPVRIGLVSVSDRASSGVYEDKGIPRCRAGWAARCATPSTGSRG